MYPPDDPNFPAAVYEVRMNSGNTNGNGKLNSIIMGFAAFGMSTLVGIACWQLTRVLDKQDRMSDVQSQQAVKLAELQITLNMVLKGQKL